jgi:hypothetical protein
VQIGGRHGTRLGQKLKSLKPRRQVQICAVQVQCVLSETLNFVCLFMQFTAVLLLRHLVAVVTVGAAHQYAFSLLTVSLIGRPI